LRGIEGDGGGANEGVPAILFLFVPAEIAEKFKCQNPNVKSNCKEQDVAH